MPQIAGPASGRIGEESLIRKFLDGQIGTITLDNPSKHNALGAALIGELLQSVAFMLV